MAAKPKALLIRGLPGGPVPEETAPAPLSAVYVYPNGSTSPANDAVWETSNPLAAALSTLKGPVTTLSYGSAGSATLKASGQGLTSAPASIVVLEQPETPATVEFAEQGPLTVDAGDLVTLHWARTLGNRGTTLEAPRVLVFELVDGSGAVMVETQTATSITVRTAPEYTGSVLVRMTDTTDPAHAPTAELELLLVPAEVEEPPPDPDPEPDPEPEPEPIPPGEAPCPWDREPALGWSKRWQFVKLAELARGDLVILKMKEIADKTGTSGQVYSDHGLAACMMAYLAPTLEARTAYATKAIARLMGAPQLQAATPIWKIGRNEVREASSTWVHLYDWLYHLMTPIQRATIQAGLERIQDFNTRAWLPNADGTPVAYDKFHYLATSEKIPYDFSGTTDNPAYIGGYSTADSDQLTSAYGLEAELTVLDVPENAINLWVAVHRIPKHVPAWGGWLATAADYGTARNALGTIVSRLGAGGEWPTSSEYNAGDQQLTAHWLWLIRTRVDVRTLFGDLLAFLEAAGAVTHLFWDRDWIATLPWGDDEEAGPQIDRIFRLLAPLAGVEVGGTSPGQRAAKRAIDELMAKRGPAILAKFNLLQRSAFFWDSSTVPQAEPLRGREAPTMQGFGTGNQWIHAPGLVGLFAAEPNKPIHHARAGGMSVRAWWQGEHVFRMPQSYGGADANRFANAPLYAGQNPMQERRGLEQVAEGYAGACYWAWGRARGEGRRYLTAAIYGGIPNFLTVGRRDVVWLVPGHGRWIAAVLRDRCAGVDPLTLATWNKFAGFKTTGDHIGDMLAALDWRERCGKVLLELVFHATEAPVAVDGGFRWGTPGGKVIDLRPAGWVPRSTVLKVDTVAPGATGYRARALGPNLPPIPTANLDIPAAYYASDRQIRLWPELEAPSYDVPTVWSAALSEADRPTIQGLGPTLVGIDELVVDWSTSPPTILAES